MLPISGRPLVGCPRLIVRHGDGNDNAEKDEADRDDQQCEQPHHGFKKVLPFFSLIVWLKNTRDP
jgi:hypothetical protein